MLRLRLIFGLSLAAGIIALMMFDGYLSRSVSPTGIKFAGSHDPWIWLNNGLICTLIVAAFVWFAARELAMMARHMGFKPFATLAQFFAVGFVLAPYISFNLPRESIWHDQALGVFWLSIAIGVSFYMQATRWQTEKALINVATTIFIVAYIGGLGGYLTKLRMEMGGVSGVSTALFTIFIVKMTDTGAYFIGSLTGRHKLIEWLSPKKTWEGFVGGMATAAACSWLVGMLLKYADVPPFDTKFASSGIDLIFFGLTMGAFSVAGDLCASLLKRDAAMKDSGNALPGLGGVIDVLDSPLLAAPAAWFFWTRLV